MSRVFHLEMQAPWYLEEYRTESLDRGRLLANPAEGNQ